MRLDLVKRGFDIARLVANDFDLDVRRQLRTDAGQRLFQSLDHFHRVRARLPANIERHRGNAVETRKRTLLFRAVFDPADIAQTHRRTVHVRDHQFVELARISETAEGAQRELFFVSGYVAAGNVGVLVLQRVFNLRDR